MSQLNLGPSMLHSGRERVSSPEESLILVDGDDRELGYDNKASVHAGEGKLHRAFSVFLFDEDERLLVHERSAQKPLWPGYWTNSCCSHPRRGEALESAVRRRIREELGVSVSTLDYAYRFQYHAAFQRLGSEHELCHVFLARLQRKQKLSVHRDEISAIRWLSVPAVDSLLTDESRATTPWFRMEWQALRGEHGALLDAFLQPRVGPRSAA